VPWPQAGGAPPDLTHEIVGSAIEELLVLDEYALDLGLEGASDAHGRL